MHNKIKGYRAVASKWFNENYFGKILGFPAMAREHSTRCAIRFINVVDTFEIKERTLHSLSVMFAAAPLR
ncbi:hypothetical protein SPRA44_600143 [Serratia proteamaculans]|nr:hypothetical protein SPRA44_600143 [Serratia proteamaculans]